MQKKSSNIPFTPKPSVHPVASFIIESVKTYPQEKCQFCHEYCLPSNPEVKKHLK